jgi:hypothetical protein
MRQPSVVWPWVPGLARCACSPGMTAWWCGTAAPHPSCRRRARKSRHPGPACVSQTRISKWSGTQAHLHLLCMNDTHSLCHPGVVPKARFQRDARVSVAVVAHRVVSRARAGTQGHMRSHPLFGPWVLGLKPGMTTEDMAPPRPTRRAGGAQGNPVCRRRARKSRHPGPACAKRVRKSCRRRASKVVPEARKQSRAGGAPAKSCRRRASKNRPGPTRASAISA